MRDAIKRERAKRLKSQQDRIGGQGDVAEFGTLRGEDAECQQQAQRADEDVAMGAQGAQQGRQSEDALGHPIAAGTAQNPREQCRAKRQGSVFGNHRRRGNTGHAPAQANHEGEIEHDVDAVERDQMEQRGARILGTEEAAENDIIGQRRWGAPNPHVVIDPRTGLNRRARFEQIKCRRPERGLCGQHRQSDDPGGRYRPRHGPARQSRWCSS